MMNNLFSLTIEESLEGLKAGKFSSVELTQSVFERIEKVESRIKAYISLFKDEALSLAKKADVERKQGSKKKLLGIPYSAKDLFNTKGHLTTASSKILDNHIALYESTVTKKLGEEGAILIGKTNSDAFAHGASTENSDFFTTRNPWNLNRLPGGSSGGSATSVVAGEAVFALGTETGGSIRHPASWCGCVGLKPSYGRVSRYGVIAMASSTDCPGVLSKTVYDSALVLNIIAGHDPKDATSSPIKAVDYSNFDSNFIKNLTLGIPVNYLGYEMQTDVKAKFLEAVEVFKKMGAKIVEINLLDPSYCIAVYTISQRAEVSSNLARYDGIRYGKTRENFGDEATRRILLGTYVLSAGYYDKYYQKAQKVRTLIIKDMDKAFSSVDLIISPTTPTTALEIGAGVNKGMFGELADTMVLPEALAGLPAVSIPCGFVSSLPVGIQIIGNRFKELGVLNVAHAYERETNWANIKPKL